MFLPYNKNLTPNAKRLRKNMTPEERKLWYGFLSKYPDRIMRQRVINHYIVDFYCAKAKLAIEIDGSQHYTEKGLEYDRIRENVLAGLEVRVIRFSNLDVNQNFLGVCNAIDNEIKAILNG